MMAPLFALVLSLIALGLLIAYRSRLSALESWLAVKIKGMVNALGVVQSVVLIGVLISALSGVLFGVLIGSYGEPLLGIQAGIQDGMLFGVLSGMLSGVLFVLGCIAGNVQSVSLKRRTKTTEAPNNGRPPQFAKYLLYYLPKKIREPLLGDLEEEYHEIAGRFGKQKATIWYYVQVAISYWPLLCSGVRKLIKWGVLGWIGDVVRRLIQ